MRSRLVRLGVVAAGVLGLFGTYLPAAHANTTLEAVFLADVTVTGGIGYPVVTLPVPPPVPGRTCLPLNGVLDAVDDLVNCHFVYDHQRAVTGGSAECEDVAANVDKPGKAPAHAGPCQFLVWGTVTGHCGLSGGQVFVTFTDALGQTFTLDLHFNGVGTVLAFTGHWHKAGSNQHGKVVAEAVAVPVPEIGGRSCLTKTQEQFLVAGTATAVTDPTL